MVRETYPNKNKMFNAIDKVNLIKRDFRNF